MANRRREMFFDQLKTIDEKEEINFLDLLNFIECCNHKLQLVAVSDCMIAWNENRKLNLCDEEFSYLTVVLGAAKAHIESRLNAIKTFETMRKYAELKHGRIDLIKQSLSLQKLIDSIGE